MQNQEEIVQIFNTAVLSYKKIKWNFDDLQSYLDGKNFYEFNQSCQKIYIDVLTTIQLLQLAEVKSKTIFEKLETTKLRIKVLKQRLTKMSIDNFVTEGNLVMENLRQIKLDLDPKSQNIEHIVNPNKNWFGVIRTASVGLVAAACIGAFAPNFAGAQQDCDTPERVIMQRTYSDTMISRASDHPGVMRELYDEHSGYKEKYNSADLLKIANYYLKGPENRDMRGKAPESEAYRFYRYAIQKGRAEGQGPIIVAKVLSSIDEYTRPGDRLRTDIFNETKKEPNGLALYNLKQGNIKEFNKNMDLAIKTNPNGMITRGSLVLQVPLSNEQTLVYFKKLYANRNNFDSDSKLNIYINTSAFHLRSYNFDEALNISAEGLKFYPGNPNLETNYASAKNR